MKLVLDEVFGNNNFQSEIIWKQTRAKSTGFNAYGLEHNSIFYYRNTSNYTWKMPYKAYDEDKFDRYYCYFEQKDNSYIKYSKADMQKFREAGKYPEGRQFALVPLLRSMDGARPNLKYEYRGFYETWSTSKEKMLELDKKGLVVQTSEQAMPQRKQYLDEMEGIKVGTIWDDIFPVNSQAKEKVDYPTQKPEDLLTRIIQASSNEGDLVADFFCGSGTTLAVAEKLGRKWIGSDLGKFGVHTTRKRMIGVQRELKKDGKDFRAFEILNVGRYERERFLDTNDNLRAEEKAKQAERKEKEFIKLILSAYRAESVESFMTVVGKKRDRLVAIGPINLPVSQKFIQEIVSEMKSKNLTKVDVLGFDYEMGLIFDDFVTQGVDISFKIIPREVFDKRAVERGHVNFYDVAYIDVKPIVTGRGNMKELAIELTDFSVFYNQDNGSIDEELKAGKSKVIIENGQVLKLTKDKATDEVSRELLTKKWSDWIDYWAIDYNFADRKEIIKVIEDGVEKEVWTGDYIFDNEWQSFRTKKNRNLELTSAPKELPKGEYKVAVKVVDIFGNDTTRVVDVTI